MGILHHHKLMWSFTQALLESLKRPVFLYLTTASFSVITLGALLFFWVETETNEKVPRFFDALYYSVTVTTGVGLGDITPVTDLGKLISMGLMLVGTAIYVSFTASLSVSIFEIELQHKKK